MLGRTLSHYKILEEISRGGMGVVYRAVDVNLNREIALKVLPPDLVDNAERKRRFVREAQAVAALDHPNIAIVHEVDEAEGVTFIAMELIRGVKLRDAIQNERLALARALELAIEVAEGLALAHEKGIAHRDLKPSNIMVTEQGHAKIIDFGLAKLVEPSSGDESEAETALRETDAGKVMGTASYMSPEQARSQKLDHRSDVFSFGIVLYEMLTGERPFKAPSGPETMSAIINAPRPSLGSAVTGELAPEIERIVDKCLAKEPRERYQATKDLVVDLRAARRMLESGVVSSVAPPSIAVLPFVDMSPAKDLDYFCEGMAEEIINALAKVEGLRVAARTSAFQFKGKAEDAGRIGKVLNVKTLLEGSVRTAGNRLRLTAQLINVDDGYDIWSERYDREMEDVFAIQDEITSKIAEALKVRLLTSEESARKKVHQTSLEAYHLYLKAKHYRLSRYDFAQARQFFERAVAEDPSYAPAYAGLAECYNHFGLFGILPPDAARFKAKEAAERALSLDSSLGEAHAISAYIEFLLCWDWNEAEREFKRAIDLDPGYAIAHAWYALLLANLGRHDEARAMAREAEKLDPLSPVLTTISGVLRWFEDDYAGSIPLFLRVLEMHPHHPMALSCLALSSVLAGMAKETIGMMQGRVPPAFASLGVGTIGFAHAAAGERDRALEIAQELEKKRQGGYVSPLLLAWIHGALGAGDEAFRWLETAFEERTPLLALLVLTKSIFHPSLRTDPRVDELARRMNLPV